MQVICTSRENFSGKAIIDERTPEVGEIVTIIGESVHKGVEVYLFQEYQCPYPWDKWGYDKRNYSPLLGIDERELVNTKEEYV